MEIKKGNITIKYSKEEFEKSLRKNSFPKEFLRSSILVVLTLSILMLETYFLNNIFIFDLLLNIAIISITIVIIMVVYTKFIIFINRKNPNYYIIYNILKIEKCKLVKFYDKIIFLYSLNSQMMCVSIDYIITNMMSSDVEIIDTSEDTIEDVYVDTIENKIFIS